jgi:hypothetical protein
MKKFIISGINTIKMLTLKYIIKSEKNAYLSNGSCFGVTDPSRLRDNFPVFTEYPKSNDEYESGKVSISRHLHDFDSFQIYMVDKELCYGLKARVMYSSFGSVEGVNEWVKDKVAFSDIKSKKLQYIVKMFD